MANVILMGCMKPRQNCNKSKRNKTIVVSTLPGMKFKYERDIFNKIVIYFQIFYV